MAEIGQGLGRCGGIPQRLFNGRQQCCQLGWLSGHKGVLPAIFGFRLAGLGRKQHR